MFPFTDDDVELYPELPLGDTDGVLPTVEVGARIELVDRELELDVIG